MRPSNLSSLRTPVHLFNAFYLHFVRLKSNVWRPYSHIHCGNIFIMVEPQHTYTIYIQWIIVNIFLTNYDENTRTQLNFIIFLHFVKWIYSSKYWYRYRNRLIHRKSQINKMTKNSKLNTYQIINKLLTLKLCCGHSESELNKWWCKWRHIYISNTI